MGQLLRENPSTWAMSEQSVRMMPVMRYRLLHSSGEKFFLDKAMAFQALQELPGAKLFVRPVASQSR